MPRPTVRLACHVTPSPCTTLCCRLLRRDQRAPEQASKLGSRMFYLSSIKSRTGQTATVRRRTHPSSEDWHSVGMISSCLCNLHYVFHVHDTKETLPHLWAPSTLTIKTQSTRAKLRNQSSPSTRADKAHTQAGCQRGPNSLYQCVPRSQHIKIYLKTAKIYTSSACDACDI